MILKCNALFNALKEHHDTRSFARSLRTISFLGLHADVLLL